MIVGVFVEDKFGEVGGVDTGFGREVQGEFLAAVGVAGGGPLGIAEVHRGGGGGPELDFADGRVAVDLEAMRFVGAMKIPFQLRQRLAGHDAAVQGVEAGDETGAVFEAVAVVGDIDEVFVAFEIVPVEVAGFERPVAVVGAEHDELRLREAVAIFPGIDDFAEGEAAGRVDLFVEAGVVVDLLGRLAAERGLLQRHVLGHVEHVDHHRGDGGGPVIDRAGEPGGPAAFARASDGVGGDVEIPFLLHGFGRGVHRFNGALGHGGEEGPRGVARFEELAEGIGDDLVFAFAFEDGLLRDVQEDCDGGFEALSKEGEDLGFAGELELRGGIGELFVPIAAGDHHHGVLGGRIDLRRLEDEELVLPGDATPSLRGEDELGVFAGEDGAFAAFGPGVAVVLRGDIVGERAGEGGTGEGGGGEGEPEE